MSVEAVRNRNILSPKEAEARKNAYTRVQNEGLLRFEKDTPYLSFRFLKFNPLTVISTIEFLNPTSVTLEADEDVESEEPKKLKTIGVVLGTLLGGDRKEIIHYVFKNENLIKRTRGAFRGEEKIEEFQTGFENVDAREADCLADFISDPNIDNLRNYRKNIQSSEANKPFSLFKRFVRVR